MLARDDKSFPVASARTAPGPKPSHKLYSVSTLQNGRAFQGRLETSTDLYHVAFLPASAAVANGKLVLTGKLTLRGRAGGERSATARARLVAIQGGIGSLGPRPQLEGGSDVATADQKQEEAKAPESRPRAAAPPATGPAVAPSRPAGSLPVTQSTGPTAYTGVLYLRFDKLDGKALGVPLDLSSVQLNARLAPQNDTERSLLWLYSDLVAALDGESRAAAADRALKQLNRFLAG